MTDTKYPFKVVRVNAETGDRLTIAIFQSEHDAVKRRDVLNELSDFPHSYDVETFDGEYVRARHG